MKNQPNQPKQQKQMLHTGPKCGGSLTMQHTVGDRFIPRRNSRSHPYEPSTNENTNKKIDILSQRLSDRFRRAHGVRLENVWGLKNTHDRIFRFSSSGLSGKTRTASCFVNKPQVWPVKPRPKPCITKPKTILDLPEFRGSFYKNLLDWGSKGLFAAVLKHFVYLWNADTQSTEILTTLETGVGTVVKWNFEGNLLAVGNSVSLIQVWNTTVKKLEFEVLCGCTSVCNINTISWHPTRAMFVSGCSNGSLCQMSITQSELIKKELREAHTGKIAQVLTSPDGKHLASCGEDGYVRLWLWSKFTFLFEIDLCLPCRALAWHPWQPSILAMGAASVSVWNINTAAMLAWHDPKRPAAISSITFSSITGEMVVSFRVISQSNAVATGVNPRDDANLKFECKVMVLGSLDKAVDWLPLGALSISTTFYLLWSPDGKKLVTAGTDENLFIWNFLGEEFEERAAMQVRNILRKGNANNHGFCIR